MNHPPHLSTRPAHRPGLVHAALHGRLSDSGILLGLLDVLDPLCAEGWLRQHTGLNEPDDMPPLDAYGVGEFVREHIVVDSGSSLTVTLACSAYRTIRGVQGWAVVNRGSFDGLVDCMVAHHHRLPLRQDIPGVDGIPQPGWKGIKLVSPSLPTFPRGSLALPA